MSDMNIPPIPPDQPDTGMFPHEPPELETAGSWLSSFLRNPGRTVNRVVKKVFREVRDTVSDVVDGAAHVVREVANTVGDVGGAVVRTGGRVIKKLVGGVVGDGDAPQETPPELNQGPRLHEENPHYRDGDSDRDHNALRIGQDFLHRIPTDTFMDAEGDPFTLSLSRNTVLPPGITFDPTTGTFSGTVGDIPGLGRDDIKTYTIVVIATDTHSRATDPQDRTAQDTFRIDVVHPNAAPVPVGTIADQEVELRGKFKIDLRQYVSDPDGDGLTYSVDDLPEGLRLYRAAGIIQGFPREAFDQTVTVTVSDSDGLSTVLTFRLVVSVPEPDNRSPVPGDPIVLSSMDEGDSADFVIPLSAFSDPDGDSLEWFQTGLPRGLSLVKRNDEDFYRIVGTASESGVFSVTITATDDDGLSASQTIQLTVFEVVPDLDEESPSPPTPSTDTPPPPPITPPHTVHRAESASTEVLTGDNARTDLFILSSLPGNDTTTDVIQNFQQGVDKIHLPGVTALWTALLDTDEDGDADATVIAKVIDNRPVGAYAVLEGFSGSLTFSDFDASGLDPSLTISVVELTII